MKTEIELPPLPDGWADGPVEIQYGVPPVGSLVLIMGKWSNLPATLTGIYAVRKWQPAIVSSGLLEPGWLVIDEDGSAWFSRSPIWDEDAREWAGTNGRLWLRETPQVTGKRAVWELM